MIAIGREPYRKILQEVKTRKGLYLVLKMMMVIIIYVGEM